MNQMTRNFPQYLGTIYFKDKAQVGLAIAPVISSAPTSPTRAI